VLLIWVFQIPPRWDSTPNDWGTSRPAFTAYGGKIQATRFAGGRLLEPLRVVFKKALSWSAYIGT
jgi:hypothetical protein